MSWRACAGSARVTHLSVPPRTSRKQPSARKREPIEHTKSTFSHYSGMQVRRGRTAVEACLRTVDDMVKNKSVT